MRWWYLRWLVVMAAVGGGWGWLANRFASWLFPHSLLGYLPLTFALCLAGGFTIGHIWHRLTWPRRRAELLKQWGMDDE